MDTETFALIVGGGPVGLSAAIELNWRGVPTILVTNKLDTAQHPKCNNTNARSMEHFRRLGIAGELRAEGLPPDVARASAYVTRFCGHEFGRLPRPYSDWPTPEIPNNVSQIVLERVLRRCAERGGGAHIHFGWRLEAFAAHDDHVMAEVVDTQTGERRQIKARYLLGIDGAGSTRALPVGPRFSRR
jgi:2-polyprenyl-6-methoxyphenol hydroxylase-like FAD-dependent oxidoreductase